MALENILAIGKQENRSPSRLSGFPQYFLKIRLEFIIFLNNQRVFSEIYIKKGQAKSIVWFLLYGAQSTSRPFRCLYKSIANYFYFLIIRFFYNNIYKYFIRRFGIPATIMYSRRLISSVHGNVHVRYSGIQLLLFQ